MPIAARLGLTIGESYLPDQVDELAAALSACNGHVLVAWEHKRIPLIAEPPGGGRLDGAAGVAG